MRQKKLQDGLNLQLQMPQKMPKCMFNFNFELPKTNSKADY